MELKTARLTLLIDPAKKAAFEGLCAQQDLTRVYPLADDPERCVQDFLELAAEHALELAERLDHQEASVQRFLELSGDG